jgi:hypothetical protein
VRQCRRRRGAGPGRQQRGGVERWPSKSRRVDGGRAGEMAGGEPVRPIIPATEETEEAEQGGAERREEEGMN